MTNALGIAAVTALLRDLLNNGLIDAQAGDVTVSIRSPDRIRTDNGEGSQLNLFLYRVTPNQGWRNVGLPSVDSPGQRHLTNPPLGLDLHYLLTAYGAADFQAEILLGYAMQVLHENPVITRAAIRAGLDRRIPALRELAGAELEDQVEQIKVIPQDLSMEDISKLWTAFGSHYRPTAAYQASVVLIQGRRRTRPALPVQESRLLTVPFREPRIEEVTAEDGELIRASSRLVIRGQRLLHDPMEVRVSGEPAEIGQRQDTSLVVDLPPDLPAGVHAVQVKHLYRFGTPADPHPGVESNVAAFVLHPEFSSWALAPPPADPDRYTGNATLTVIPPVRATQRVVLLLNRDSAAQPAAYSFTAAPRSTDADPIVVRLENVRSAEYFVRVQVDGAESPLDLDPSSPTFGPRRRI